MFRIQTLDTKKTVEFKGESQFFCSANEPQEDFHINLQLTSEKRVPISDDYSASVSVNSEWLDLKNNFSTKNDLRNIKSLLIEENSQLPSAQALQIQGDMAHTFYVSDSNWVFYYYVDQGLTMVQSRTQITYLKDWNYRIQHESETDLYKISIDTQVCFEGFLFTLWKKDVLFNEKNIQLQKRFKDHFDEADYNAPIIKENDRVVQYKYIPKSKAID